MYVPGVQRGNCGAPSQTYKDWHRAYTCVSQPKTQWTHPNPRSSNNCGPVLIRTCNSRSTDPQPAKQNVMLIIRSHSLTVTFVAPELRWHSDTMQLRIRLLRSGPTAQPHFLQYWFEADGTTYPRYNWRKPRS